MGIPRVRAKGVPYQARLIIAAVGLSLSALIASAAALVFAGSGHPTPAVVLDATGTTVTSVLPGSFAWSRGVRSGHLVRVEFAEGSPDLVLFVRSPEGDHRVDFAVAVIELRSAVPLAALALLLALAGVPFPRARLRKAAAAAGLAIVVASVPLFLTGDAVVSSVAAVGAILAPAVWLALWGPRIARWAGIAGLALAGAWLMARFVLPAAFDVLDIVRLGATGLLAIAVLGTVLPLREIRRASIRPALLIEVALGVIALGVAFALGAPREVVILLGLALVIMFGSTRHALGGAIDRILFADARRSAAIAVEEATAGRLAGDVHDGPLQDLSAVVRRLESVPETASERDAIRRVADDLRGVAGTLRPPALDDLGLGAALHSAVMRLEADGCTGIELAVDDRTAPERGRRLPSEVELAGYRILSEAVSNACRHARATRIVVAGTIAPDRLLVSVTDDGAGFDAWAAEQSARSGRMGLATMRGRAEAIGAALTITHGRPSGTAVTLDWRA